MNTQGAIEKMNHLGLDRVPFLFLIDFEQEYPLVFPLNELPDDILFATPLFPVPPRDKIDKHQIVFEKSPIDKKKYSHAFSEVMYHLRRGDTYLLNLTFPTSIRTDLSLEEIFISSKAPYRLFIKDRFVVFSPEPFVTIKQGHIYSNPMKGTIDAGIRNAEKIILDDPKESAEHHTIVDLIRNDLSMVAKDIEVTRFRYIESIQTHEKEILQVSSEIRGRLTSDYRKSIGSLIKSLLPAGSVSGAPKSKTVEIIRQVEGNPRGYYTGVFGVFDGEILESAVMIRYIEQVNGQMIFRSGGGITHRSQVDNEFNELIDKVYVSLA